MESDSLTPKNITGDAASSNSGATSPISYQKKDFNKDHLNDFHEIIGQVKNGDFVEVKVQVKKYNGKWYVDCRQWMDKETFKGPLKKGFQLSFEEFESFKDIINKVDLSKYGDDKLPEVRERSDSQE